MIPVAAMTTGNRVMEGSISVLIGSNLLIIAAKLFWIQTMGFKNKVYIIFSFGCYARVVAMPKWLLCQSTTRIVSFIWYFGWHHQSCLSFIWICFEFWQLVSKMTFLKKGFPFCCLSNNSVVAMPANSSEIIILLYLYWNNLPIDKALSWWKVWTYGQTAYNILTMC